MKKCVSFSEAKILQLECFNSWSKQICFRNTLRKKLLYDIKSILKVYLRFLCSIYLYFYVQMHLECGLYFFSSF